MTIRQVLLNGSGTSGDGTTWDDASDATSAYIALAGLVAAVAASAIGDIVYAKGSDTTSTATADISATSNLAFAQNPVQILGCKSATTNNQGSIIESDLIQGIRANGGSTPAYLDADVPLVQPNSTAADIFLDGGLYVYGVRFVSGDNLVLGDVSNSSVILEESSVEVTGSGDVIYCGGDNVAATGVSVVTINSRLKGGASGALLSFLNRGVHFNTVISLPGANGIFGNGSNAHLRGHHEFHGCDLADGGETTIIAKRSGQEARILLSNCKYPASWTLTGGTAQGPYRFESYGSDDTAGLTTSGSEQQVNIESQHGTIVTETTKVRTGGADDGADGLYSYDFSTFANGTALGIAGLSTKLAPIWVAGDGTAKTLTIFFTSDSGNTRATDWLDTEVWGTVEYPDEAGTSQYNYKSSVADLLAAGSAVTDDTGSTWGAGTARDQKIELALSPDYEGYVIPSAHFAPGANAEIAYFDPLPTVA